MPQVPDVPVRARHENPQRPWHPGEDPVDEHGVALGEGRELRARLDAALAVPEGPEDAAHDGDEGARVQDEREGAVDLLERPVEKEEVEEPGALLPEEPVDRASEPAFSAREHVVDPVRDEEEKDRPAQPQILGRRRPGSRGGAW